MVGSETPHPPIHGAATAQPVSHGQEWLISAGGAVSSGLTIGLITLIDRALGFDLSSLSVWVVIPVGAVAAGMGAASGYYFAAKWTHTMPGRRFLRDMLIIAIGAWGVLHWLQYSSLTFEDGTRVSDQVDFLTWFQYSIEHTSLTIRARAGATGVDTGGLGAWGYPRELLQFVGFAVGGLGVYAMLRDAPTCDSCRKYMTTRTLNKKLLSADEFDDWMERAGVGFPNLVEHLKVALGRDAYRGLGIEAQTCPGCGARKVVPLVWIGRRDEPTRLPRYDASAELIGRLEETVEQPQHGANA